MRQGTGGLGAGTGGSWMCRRLACEGVGREGPTRGGLLAWLVEQVRRHSSAEWFAKLC